MLLLILLYYIPIKQTVKELKYDYKHYFKANQSKYDFNTVHHRPIFVNLYPAL